MEKLFITIKGFCKAKALQGFFIRKGGGQIFK